MPTCRGDWSNVRRLLRHRLLDRLPGRWLPQTETTALTLEEDAHVTPEFYLVTNPGRTLVGSGVFKKKLKIALVQDEPAARRAFSKVQNGFCLCLGTRPKIFDLHI